MFRVCQPYFFRRVTDERGLHQHGRDVWRLQHHEAGRLHLTLVYVANPVQFAEHQPRRTVAGGNSVPLRQIHKHRSDRGIYLVKLDPTREVGSIFTVCQPARRLTAGATGGEDIDRRTCCRTVVRCVCVDGDKQIGAGLARAQHALAKIHEMVAVTNQIGPHARFALQGSR